MQDMVQPPTPARPLPHNEGGPPIAQQTRDCLLS